LPMWDRQPAPLGRSQPFGSRARQRNGTLLQGGGKLS
jgi:hypothetical protein